MAKELNPAKPPKYKSLRPSQRFSKGQLLAFILIFAAIGGYFLIRSFAYYDPTALVLYHANGDLVQSAGDSKIYLIENNQRHFVNLEAFNSGDYSANDVLSATTGDEQLSIGDPIVVPSGNLIQDRFSGSYYLSDQDSSGQVIRRPVDMSALKALGYSPASAVVSTNLPPVQGNPLSGNSAHPQGTKITTSVRGGQAYLVDNGQLRPASSDVIASYGLSKAPTLLANAADLALPKGPALGFASGTLVQGSDTTKTYVIDNNGDSISKRLIRSQEVFMALGYDSKNIVKLADNQLPSSDGLPLPENDGTPVAVNVNIKAGQDGTSLANDYSAHTNTTVTAAYKDWVALKLPFSDIAGLRQDPRVASVNGSAASPPTYLACDGPNGNVVPCPVINSFSPSPSSVTAGSSSTLSWSASYSNYCTASGGWSGQLGTSGSQSTGALNATTSFSLTCYGQAVDPTGASTSVSVTSPPPPPPPTGAPAPTINSFTYNSGNSFNYNVSGATSCEIHTDNPAGGVQQFTPANGSTATVTAGNGGGGALFCYNQGTPAAKNGIYAGPSSAPPPPCSGSTLANNTAPVISGSATVGSTLTASSGTWCGAVNGYSYSWEDCSADNPTNRLCTYISTGNGKSSYNIQPSDAGYQLEVIVTASGSSSSASAASAWTNIVPGAPAPPPPPPPVTLTNTGLPVITGTTQVGSTLATTKGSWTGSPTSYTYLWQRCNPDNPANRICTNIISSTTATSYTLVAADVDNQIQVRVTASNSSSSVPATSAATAVVQAAPTGGSPSGGCNSTSNGVYLYSGTNYTGSCQVFTSSSAAPSSWAIGNDTASSIKVVGSYTATVYTDANYGGTESMFSLSHTDLAPYDIGDRSASSMQIAIGALNRPPSLDCGSTITSGIYLYTLPSWKGSCAHFTATSLSAESWGLAPNNIESVRVSSDFAGTLYANDNLRGGALNLSGSLSSLTGTSVGYGTSSIFAAKKGGGWPLNTGLPTIKGSPYTGNQLTSTPGTWSPAATNYTYQWYDCNGPNDHPGFKCSQIGGATGVNYTVKQADVAQWIELEVTAYNSAGSSLEDSATTAQVTSSPVAQGSAQVLAQEILSNPNINKSGRDVILDLQDAAQGRPGTAGAPVALGVLQLIESYGQKHSAYISAIESGGTGHCNNTPKSACPGDPHYNGTAVDFDGGLTGRDAISIGIINFTEQNFTSARFGQKGCNGVGLSFPAGFSEITDTCNHLHVDSIGSPRTGSSASQSATAPVISAFGGTTSLSWSTTNAVSCNGTGGINNWIGARELNSNNAFSVGRLAKDTVFTLTCTSSYGAKTSQDYTVPANSGLVQVSPGLAAIGWTPNAATSAVAVVGTGVDLIPGLNVSYSFNSAKVANCSNGAGNFDGSADKHDTEVAKMIGLVGDGLSSPAGVAPGTNIIGVRATDGNSGVPTESGIACGIRWAADQGIKIINVSSAAAVSNLPNGLDLDNCNAANTEAELQAICYAVSKGAKVITAAGNYGTNARNYIPARFNQAYTITSANEFNGLPPNSPAAASQPKNSSSYIINGFSGFCGVGQDDFGQAAMDYNGGKANFYAAPVCVWLGQNVGQQTGYDYGTSFAAAMASGVLSRGGSLSGGGVVGSTRGHSYGSEIHL